MKKHWLIISVIIALLAVSLAYWYFLFYGPGATVTPIVSTSRPSNGFTPFSRPPSGGNNASSTDNTPSPSPSIEELANSPVPILRMINGNPVGGYGASTTWAGPKQTGTTTVSVRWIDRGRGNIYETTSDSLVVTTLSNTILPRIYESVWNKNLSAFIGTMFSEKSDTPDVLYASLVKQIIPVIKPAPANASSTASTTPPTVISNLNNLTPYELKGRNLPDNMLGYAVSPKGDKIFMLVEENSQASGYTAKFDGTSVVKIFTSPLLQVNVDWPEENTIVITTKASANTLGYLYFVNAKTGAWKKILGPAFALNGKTSHDAKYVLYSQLDNQKKLTTGIYSVTKLNSVDAVIQTLADKCAWGNFFIHTVYCAVPTDPITAVYPDDWYIGRVSSLDKIWQVDAETGSIHLVTPIIDRADRVIDAYNLSLDIKDNFLYFMNKNDLSLWSFDLSAKN
ncbi:MAG: hypothetical protein WCT02_00985 [Candidatus Paceibacterota bacterium]